MLNTKSFLTVDFGAGTLKVAEFDLNEAGNLRLRQYGLKSLGAEGAQESSREATILKALQELLAQKGIKARNVNVCAPGFHVFSKFVKLPPVDAGKVTQIIQYEAQQNVPFPLEEVVWDYQILGSTPGGELEVLLVAIKADIVEGLFRVTEAAGLNLQVADVSPAALCNAFRYNYGDLEDCTMLLDIGAKTSNLLFFEKGKVFSRSINLGANSITQDFANESKLKFDAAEKLKIDEGFVSLGGAYAEPENANQAAISKIARQFMTRLHIQVNQTMQFYRGQQGGSAPQRLFLSGGASVMAYTPQFFAEKLNVPVEYFNPLRNLDRDPNINVEDLQHVAHSLGEVVGLGLRNLAHCPVELNLMPESTLKWQAFNQKKPYFMATVFSLVLVTGAGGFLFDKLASVKQEEIEKITPDITNQEQNAEKFKQEYGKLNKTQKQIDQLIEWMNDRSYWADAFSEVRRVLIRVESTMKGELQADTGVWIERFISAEQTPEDQNAMNAPAQPQMTGPRGGLDKAMRERYGLDKPAAAAAEGAATGGAPPPKPKPGGTNEVALVTVTFRGVSLTSVQPEANKRIAYAVLTELQNSPLFDKDQTQFAGGGTISADEAPGTFTFPVTLALKKPLKL